MTQDGQPLLPFCSTQKILHHARLAERGVVVRDPMKEAIGLELDMLNILYAQTHSFLTSGFAKGAPLF
jgi:hypothetical protein